MNVLIACEFSGVVREAFRKRGHNVWSCDLLPSEDNSAYHIQMDVKILLEKGINGLPKKWDLIIAHPPCTYLAVSGNRWYSKRPDLYMPAVEFAKLFFNYADKVCVENPVGRLSTLWRKPDQYVQPWMFGDPFEKKTGLWLKGLSKLKPTNIVKPEERVVLSSGKSLPAWYNLPPSEERSNIRSKTFPGFANAMATTWG